MREYLLVDPTQEMLDIFEDVIRRNRISGSFFSIFLGQSLPCCGSSSIQSIERVDELRDREISVLCCSEEAVYWLSNHMSEKWKTQFQVSYFCLLDKLSFKEYVSTHGLPVCKYWQSAESVSQYPIVGKPSIGFASMGIQRLPNADECKRFEQAFTGQISASVVEKYRRMYFSDCENKPIFEEEKDGDFFRTSFLVQNHRCEACFPVKGTKQSCLPGKEFSWVEFEYKHQATEEYLTIEKLVNQIIAVFDVEDGVYVAEFMSTRKGEVFLLEFSPRITSTRIVKLIQYATGVDLLEAMACLFLNMEFTVPKISRDKVILRITRNTEEFEKLDEVFFELPSNIERSAHGDTIDCKYYKKGETNR